MRMTTGLLASDALLSSGSVCRVRAGDPPPLAAQSLPEVQGAKWALGGHPGVYLTDVPGCQARGMASNDLSEGPHEHPPVVQGGLSFPRGGMLV